MVPGSGEMVSKSTFENSQKKRRKAPQHRVVFGKRPPFSLLIGGMVPAEQPSTFLNLTFIIFFTLFSAFIYGSTVYTE